MLNILINISIFTDMRRVIAGKSPFYGCRSPFSAWIGSPESGRRAEMGEKCRIPAGICGFWGKI
jgi:hypothetical protein